MIANYIKIAVRNLQKRKLTTAINIFGLSFGIACASMAFVFIQHELTFDQFHDESEKIHAFYGNINDHFNTSGTPAPLASDLVEDFPEVTEGIRMEGQSVFIQSGTENFKEKILFTDPSFFSFFNFPLVNGDKKSALKDINSIVLTETTAKKYFGRKDPVGEMLPIVFKDEEFIVKVTGVAKNPPTNSSIQFQFLLPIQFAYKDDLSQLDSDWNSFPTGSFIRLREKEDIAGLVEKLPGYVNTKFDNQDEEKGSNIKFIMTPLDDYHLNNNMRINGLTTPGEPRYVKILAIIALLILFVACLNFMNLSNAQSSHRLKEVGVRQVLGARRRELIFQFLSESLLLSFLSLMVAVLLLSFFIPLTSSLFDYTIQFDLTEPSIFLPLVGIAIFTGLLAGSYPSFLLSNLSTVKTFKTDFKIGGNNWVTKTSMVFQFTLAIGLLACTGIMQQQQRFISQHNLGYDKEEIIVIPTQIENHEKFQSGRFVEQFRSEIQNYEGVKQMSAVSNSFNRGNKALFIKGEDGSQKIIMEYNVDENYLDLLKIELKEGRNFSTDMQEDIEKSVIINEAFQREYQIDNIESYRFPTSFNDEYAGSRIIGIVKDYHFNHLRTKITPMLLSMKSKPKFGHILVKVKPENIDQTIAHLKTSWQKTRQDKSFKFNFLDEDLQEQYLSETRWNKVLTGASTLAILITMFGLFGLLALILTQRTKEIGIRKILGARMDNIMILLSKDFIKLIGIAFIIAAPIAWYYMNLWLEDFAYHIKIQWWVFVLTGLAVTAIAVLTISFQSIKAALINPSESLRND